MNINESLSKKVKALREAAEDKFNTPNFDFDEEDYTEDEVFGEALPESGVEFNYGTESYVWEKPFSSEKEVNDHLVQIWSAKNIFTDNIVYFVVDPEDAHILDGPFTTLDEIQEEDTELEEDFSEFEEIKKNGLTWEVCKKAADYVLLHAPEAKYQSYAVVLVGQGPKDWKAVKFFYNEKNANIYLHNISSSTGAKDFQYNDEEIEKIFDKKCHQGEMDWAWLGPVGQVAGGLLTTVKPIHNYKKARRSEIEADKEEHAKLRAAFKYGKL